MQNSLCVHMSAIIKKTHCVSRAKRVDLKKENYFQTTMAKRKKAKKATKKRATKKRKASKKKRR